MKVSALTGKNNYFEDFHLGMVMEHAHAKTVGELENTMFTNMAMIMAHAHLNEDEMSRDPRRHRTVFGGVTSALVIGLASQDTSENALAELALDKLRFTAPVFHGDTLYAYSEVLEVSDGTRLDAGEVRFRHWGVNQRREVVFETERTVLIKRRSHWRID